MRTVTNVFLKKLIAQRDEAKTLGLAKIAAALTEQIAVTPVRTSEAAYTYERDDLQADVEASLWDAAIRSQDFYGRVVDAREIQHLIEKHAEEFIDSIRRQAGVLIGAHESPVPGELSVSTDFAIEDARGAKEYLKNLLVGKDWVRGVGISRLDDNTWCVVLKVSEMNDDVRNTVPENVDGVPVIVEVSGEMVPYQAG